jgi:hypothetical protein
MNDFRRFMDAVSPLCEGLDRYRIDAKTLARAIHNQWTYDQGESITMAYVRDSINEVRALAKGRLTVWRALHFEKFPYFDADNPDEDDVQTVLRDLPRLINWKELGTSWTNEREAAVFNGALAGGNPNTVLLQTVVRPNQINWVATIWQRCTVYQEEEEIRLWPNIPLLVTATIPMIKGMPKRGNTGHERWMGDDRVDDEIRASAARPVQRLQESAESSLILPGGKQVPVTAPSESIGSTIDASFDHGVAIGPSVVPLTSLYGGVSLTDPAQAARVKKLQASIAGPDGYFSRPIVDDTGDVIEGQHRIEALRQMGVKNVPVYVVKDLAKSVDLLGLKAVVDQAQKMRSDVQHQLIRRVLDAIHDEGSAAAAYEAYEAPQGYQNAWDAALRFLG